MEDLSSFVETQFKKVKVATKVEIEAAGEKIIKLLDATEQSIVERLRTGDRATADTQLIRFGDRATADTELTRFGERPSERQKTLYDKQRDTPSLSYGVSCLRNIRKGGLPEDRLNRENVQTVEDFLLANLINSAALERVSGLHHSRFREAVS